MAVAGAVALPIAAPVTPPRSLDLPAALSGLWEKNQQQSEVVQYEAMMNMLELGGLQKVSYCCLLLPDHENAGIRGPA